MRVQLGSHKDNDNTPTDKGAPSPPSHVLQQLKPKWYSEIPILGWNVIKILLQPFTTKTQHCVVR